MTATWQYTDATNTVVVRTLDTGIVESVDRDGVHII
jgi:hypothetical protein